ncbi:MAG: glycosyltransferase [Candidatus Marinimicrobia bacterium]|nr:glycosyltransferase [Candidatus Neomarinimicrobiota bacterium]
MSLLSLALIVFKGCLVVYVLALGWFILGQLRPEPPRSRAQPSVSVIVAARNWTRSLGPLLEQLQNQDYPPAQLECVVVDDGLSAASLARVQEAVGTAQNFKVVNSSVGGEELAHKKRALDAGIRSSAGEILLFTDADCQVGPGWVSSLVGYFTPATDYVVGWSRVAGRGGAAWAAEPEAAERPLTVFEQVDFTMLMLAGRGATLMGTAWASSGQNQAYRRRLFKSVGGFHDLAHRLGGDDALFLQLVRRKAGARVTFASDPNSWVVTGPAQSLRLFLAQRIRWAGEAVGIVRVNPAFLVIPLATLGVNLLIIVLAVAALTRAGAVLPTLIPAVLLKAAAEALLLTIGSRKLPLGDLRRHFPFWFLLHIPYLSVVGLASLWGNRLPWVRSGVEEV